MSEQTPATGRRRCGIPEHRKQIRALQKWCAFLQLQHGLRWSQRHSLNLEIDAMRRDCWRFKHALTKIATDRSIGRNEMIQMAIDATAEPEAR